MKRASLILLLAALCLASNPEAGYGQQHDKREPQREFILSVFHQPECPLKFEEVGVLKLDPGSIFTSMRVRNTSDKTIVSVWIQAFSQGEPTFGKIVSYHDAADPSITYERYRIAPGEVLTLNKFTDEGIEALREKLRRYKSAPRPLPERIDLLVVRVEFEDGTSYDAQRRYKLNLPPEDDR